MAKTHIDKRSRLVNAAVGLAYQNGFGATSLADIAREAEVPLGNVYYYFKTKDDIGEAIVELRLTELATQRQRWNEAGSPKDRLCACVQGVFENKDFLAERGCAVGTFCSELQGGRLGRHQSDRDLRSTPGLDREPVSDTREGEGLQGTRRPPAFRHARRLDPGSFLS